MSGGNQATTTQSPPQGPLAPGNRMRSRTLRASTHHWWRFGSAAHAVEGLTASCSGARNALSRECRVFTTSFASVYLHCVTKVERTGRTKAELGQVIQWLTGFDETALGGLLAASTTVEDSFEEARVNPSRPVNRPPDQVVRLLRAPYAPDNVWSRRNGGARW